MFHGSLKINLLANYVGRCWQAGISLVFIPVYIRFLGIEAYGVIGFFAILQGILNLLDMGLRPAVTRELARYSAGTITPFEIRGLLKACNLTYLAFATLAVLICFALAKLIASRWLQSDGLAPEEIVAAVKLMGLVIGMRLIESIYSAGLTGLQRQGILNFILVVMSTLRAAGAAAVLCYYSASLQAFFIWQAIVSLVGLIFYAVAVYRVIPTVATPVPFSMKPLRSIWRFAGGMFAITFLSIVLIQADKLVLSAFLSLSEFATYTLAATMVGSLYFLTGPIANVFFPRFTARVASDSNENLIKEYHLAAQTLSGILGPAALTLVFFSSEISLLWTKNAEIANQIAPLISILACGALIHGSMTLPYQIQLAYGWTMLNVKVNSIAIVIFIPLLLLLVSIYGVHGAAIAWLILNFFSLIVITTLMHKRILPLEKIRWFLYDLSLPIAMAALVGFTSSRFAVDGNFILIVLHIILTGIAMLVASVAVSSELRSYVSVFWLKVRDTFLPGGLRR